MSKRYFLMIISLLILFFGFVSITFAASEADIHFPVAELGNCANKQECKAYCNAPEHIQACVAFAKRHNLLSKKEIERGEKFAKVATKAGPGGCRGHEACQTYCENIDHIEECVAFGEEHGLIPSEELQEAKKVAQALKRGIKPPAGCNSKQACEAYCSQEGHFEECITFGRKAGFVSEEEYQMAKKTQGKGPGGCRGKEQCEAYCQDENHIKECVDFGRKHGFISEKEADIAIKTGGKGPGGCRRDECKTYCENPDHQDECMNFAKEHGLISEDELKHMEEGKRKFQEALTQAPQEVQECIREVVGPDLKERIQNGAIQPGPEIGERVRECFEKQRRDEAQFQGPGGCNGPEECKAYCSDAAHAPECQKFFQGKGAPEQGKGMMGRPPVDMRPSHPGDANQDENPAVGGGHGEFRPHMGPGSRDPNSRADANGEVCIQVITPARDPRTDACHEFPTPCAVPPGWERVDACDKRSDRNVAPPMREGEQGMPPRFQGPGGCATQEECATYCGAHPAECGITPGANQDAHTLPQAPPPPPASDSPMELLQSLGAMAMQAFLFLAGK